MEPETDDELDFDPDAAPPAPKFKGVKPVPIKFEQEVLRALRVASRVEDRPVSQIIRIAVRKWLLAEKYWSPAEEPGPIRK